MDTRLKKIILESGNNLHLEVVKTLEEKDWQVDLSAYYYDDTANKPREIDIVARKKIRYIPSQRGKPITDWRPYTFQVFLFIECKYFKNEIAFRIHPTTRNKEAVACEGMNKDEVLEDVGNLHHYLKVSSIAQLYDTIDQDAVFNAITQPVKSLTFFKDRQGAQGLYYPITIYSGIDGVYALHGKKQTEENLDALKLEDYTIVGLDYSYRSPVSQQLRTNYFFVDFLHKDRLSDLLKTIDNETQAVASHLGKALSGN